MKLILTDERADFDTIGAMLGAFVLHEDSALVLPEHFLPRAQVFMERFYNKLPFEAAEAFRDQQGQWLYPRLDGLLFGFDFLQSVHIARQLQAVNQTLDDFHASTILLGIYASANTLNSFSADAAVTAVVPYLLEQGADESAVREWLTADETAPSSSMIKMQVHVLEPEDEILKQTAGWQRLLEDVVVAAAREMQVEIYGVGGVVRDMLLKRRCRDLDFVVEGNAISLGQLLRKKYGGQLVLHQAFGTARWEFAEALPRILSAFPNQEGLDFNDMPSVLDLITARTEWYEHPADLPRVRPGRIELDLRRRDFTINSLGLRLDSKPLQLLDACGGLNDLQNGLVRALHPLSFRDDPTRLFRAVRYEQRLGFAIENETRLWMEDALVCMQQVSGDRLRHELNLMMTESDPVKNFQRMDELGLLSALHSGLQWRSQWADAMYFALQEPAEDGWQFTGVSGNLSSQQWQGYAVWLAQQPTEVLSAVSKLLRFSKLHRQSFEKLHSVLGKIDRLQDARNSEWAAALDGLPMEMLYTLDCIIRNKAMLHRRVIEYRDQQRDCKAHITGEGLQEMGIPEGKIYAEVLTLLRNAWLDGFVHSRAEEMAYLENLLKEQGDAAGE